LMLYLAEISAFARVRLRDFRRSNRHETRPRSLWNPAPAIWRTAGLAKGFGTVRKNGLTAILLP
jgi:hypothetical protein